jgi:NADPH:quinone reductase-like Zn-dependent oxidoreductase
VALARHAGARVIGTVRSASEKQTALNAGAHEVVLSDKELVAQVRKLTPGGVDHIVEVAFGANIEADVELLRLGGSIASYATDNPTLKIPFWQMVFKNIGVFFPGSDDFRFSKGCEIASRPGFEYCPSGGMVRLRDRRANTARRHRSRPRACGTPRAARASRCCAVSI